MPNGEPREAITVELRAHRPGHELELEAVRVPIPPDYTERDTAHLYAVTVETIGDVLLGRHGHDRPRRLAFLGNAARFSRLETILGGIRGAEVPPELLADLRELLTLDAPEVYARWGGDEPDE